MSHIARTRRNESSGYILATLAMILLPLLLIAAGAVITMVGRQQTSSDLVAVERALMAAEAGVDHTIHRAATGALVLGDTIDVDLDSGVSYSVTAIDTHADGIDNDGDLVADETDEAGIQVTSVGRYRKSARAVVAYLRPISSFPVIEATLYLRDPWSIVGVSGNSFTITGRDKNLDGSVGPAPDVPAVAVVAPGSLASALSGLKGSQKSNITGAGSSPSTISTGVDVDIQGLVDQFRTRADTVLAGGKYTKIDGFGDAAKGDWRITHCAGNLALTGSQHGGGLLCVDGDLDFGGTVNFTGIVLVTGKLSFSGGGSSKTIRGCIFADGGAGGASVEVLAINGGVDIQYSSQAIAAVIQRISTIVLVGWRETAVP